MGSGLSTPLGTAGTILLITGVVVTVVGVIFLIIYQNEVKPWWVWVLVILGIILSIIGGVMMAIALSHERCETECSTIISYD
jgi:hypothetical protein